MKLLADENFNNEIVRGLKRRVPEVEILRVQDTELASKPDSTILAWAAEHNYIVLSHDVNTMRGLFYDLQRQHLPVPGLFLVLLNKPIGAVIDTLEMILLASDASEWQNSLHYLPFP